MSEQRAGRLRGAIVTRMRAEEAASVDDSEIARTLGACVCGRSLIEAATWLRDAGHLCASDVTLPA
jgi:hypothetical protein